VEKWQETEIGSHRNRRGGRAVRNGRAARAPHAAANLVPWCGGGSDRKATGGGKEGRGGKEGKEEGGAAGRQTASPLGTGSPGCLPKKTGGWLTLGGSVVGP
jgi:hypothetical protein